MYFQKDYVLRMIEMMGDLMRRVCDIARDADALAELDEIAQKACGLPLTLLETGDADMLTETLWEAQRYLAAELLMIEHEILLRAQTSDTLLPLRQQALVLYGSVREPDYALPASDQAARLLDNNPSDDLPPDILLSAAALFEHAGDYARAEDAYFAAVDQSAACGANALAFYDRLEKLDDRALLAGNFSREEIAEGRDALNV